jgi:DNA/RNA-binding domain of Phe-tRNA-synthetase-like protein
MERILVVDSAWRAACPGASFGVLALSGVRNPGAHPAMAAEAERLERELRERFGSLDQAALRATPPLPAYAAWYKRFGQRYHVMMQLESVAQKGKAIPRVAALVEAMFVAELRTLVLTAGHDLDAAALPVVLGVDGAGREERYATLGGKDAAVKPGDMVTRDGGGVLSAIVTGPSDRARITPETNAALFVAYGPPGVGTDLVEAHLDEIERLVRLVAPGAERVGREVVSAEELPRSA